MDPTVYGDYLEVMKKSIGKRLPSFTSAQSKKLRGSLTSLEWIITVLSMLKALLKWTIILPSGDQTHALNGEVSSVYKIHITRIIFYRVSIHFFAHKLLKGLLVS